MRSKKTKLKFCFLTLNPLTDSYPSIKYREKIFRKIYEPHYKFISLASKKTVTPKANIFGLITRVYSLVLSMFLVVKLFFVKAERLYISYPGVIFLAFFKGYLNKRFSVIYLDAFISIYDTVVHDRKLITESNVIAKALYFFELRAYKAADVVIVDTIDNALYLSQLFKLDESKFIDVPLSIPNSYAGIKKNKKSTQIQGVFIGTFVPLQGVPILFNAAKKFSQSCSKNILNIDVVGDGQDADECALIFKSDLSPIVWSRGHFGTQFIIDKLSFANFALGIFASNHKSERVIPFKIYIYLAAGLPVITAKTKAILQLEAKCKLRGIHSPFIFVEKGSDKNLYNCLIKLSNGHYDLSLLSLAAKRCYIEILGPDICETRIKDIFQPRSKVLK